MKRRFSEERSRSKSQEMGSLSDENTSETVAIAAVDSPLSPVTENSANDSVSIGEVRFTYLMLTYSEKFSSVDEQTSIA